MKCRRCGKDTTHYYELNIIKDDKKYPVSAILCSTKCLLETVEDISDFQRMPDASQSC